jgi:glucose/arabinose dehydrogenase
MRYAFIIVFCVLSKITMAQPTVALTEVKSGLTIPLQVTHAGDGTNRIFVLQKGGSILTFDKNFNFLDTFLVVTGLGTANEQGLLSMAFHPNYRTNGYFYIRATQATTNAILINRYTVSSTNANKANPSSMLSIFNIPHANTNHNGGEMHFGKDGYLYISNGDAGGSGDPNNDGQSNTSLLAKMLRIDVDNPSGGNNYGIPSTNPITNSPIFCKGLRNPFRWSFDRFNGDLYLGDVGQNNQEELDYLPANEISNANFGWDCMEGNIPYTPGGCPAPTNYKAPVFWYTINGTNGRSIIGGVIYRGYQYPDLKGWYFTIDYYNAILRKFDRRVSTNAWTPVTQTLAFNNITDFGESEDGEVYIPTAAGRVYKLTHSNAKTMHTFTGSGNWSLGSNWKSGTPPSSTIGSNEVIVIKPYFGGFCNLDGPQTVGIGADIFVEPGADFRINSNLTVKD